MEFYLILILRKEVKVGNNTLYEVIIHATETPSNYSFKKTIVAKDLYGVEKNELLDLKQFLWRDIK